MTHEEEMALRELAAGRCVIPKVTEVLGPMSLWSKSGLEAEIRKAVEAEREACAKLCEEGGKDESGRIHVQAWGCAKAIRARGELK